MGIDPMAIAKEYDESKIHCNTEFKHPNAKSVEY